MTCLVNTTLVVTKVFTSYDLSSVDLARGSAAGFPGATRSTGRTLTTVCRGLGGIGTFPRRSFLCGSLLTYSSVLNNNNPGSGLVRSLSLVYGANAGTARSC